MLVRVFFICKLDKVVCLPRKGIDSPIHSPERKQLSNKKRLQTTLLCRDSRQHSLGKDRTIFFPFQQSNALTPTVHKRSHPTSLSHRRLCSFSLQEQVSNSQRPVPELTPSFFMKHLFLDCKREILCQINFLSLFLHYGGTLILT